MIAEIATFMKECLASGALLGSLCAMLFVPPLAWLAVRALAPVIFRMNADRPWQAALAALAGAMPGIIFAVTAIVGIAGGIANGCLQYPAGRAVFTTIAVLAILSFVRAVWLAFRRSAELSALFRCSEKPTTPRLIGAAASIPAPVRELRSDLPFCAVGGNRKPTLFVSRGTLAALSDAQLHAALLHEYAHVVRRDPLTASLVTFFSDLLPLATGDLVRLYREAREFVADAYAKRQADPGDLADAVVAMTRAARPASAFAAFASETGVRARVDALFAEASKTRPALQRWIALTGLLAVAALGAAPAIAALLHYSSCAGMRA